MTDISKNFHDLMARVQISSIDELSDRSGLSIWYLYRIEGGLMEHIPLAICRKLAHTLELPLPELMDRLCPLTELEDGTPKTIETVGPDGEPHRQPGADQLKQQVAIQEQELIAQWQAQSLAILEPWLMQWPTASTIAKTTIDLPAVRLLPLVKPLENLVKSWGLEAIGQVGAIVNYDPTCHELLEGKIEPGESVIIRYIGYRQHDRLWCRAKVSVPEDETHGTFNS